MAVAAAVPPVVFRPGSESDLASISILDTSNSKRLSVVSPPRTSGPMLRMSFLLEGVMSGSPFSSNLSKKKTASVLSDLGGA